MLALIPFFIAFGVAARPVCDTVPWKLPFHTHGPHILSADNKLVQYVGTNWPGHQDAMIPEGLQYSSIKGIVSKIKSLNLNVVRLTFAIELVDDIFNRGDVSLENTLINALGPTNGSLVLGEVLKHNPGLSKHTTRLQVYDAVALELAAQGVYLHLDNHMSKALWCCSGADGNGWFGDTYFNVSNWQRGWAFMAAHVSFSLPGQPFSVSPSRALVFKSALHTCSLHTQAYKNWPSFSSVGLRNELRQPNSPSPAEPYDWYTWYTHMTSAASIVHTIAPDVLIFFSGFNYDSNLIPVVEGLPLTGTANTTTAGKSAIFKPSDFEFKEKIVLELHKYDFEHTQANCIDFAKTLYDAGYNTLNTTDPAVVNQFPMVLTEWGFTQNGTYWHDTTYNKCLIEFMANLEARGVGSGWIHWELSGSFYIKTSNGVSAQDLDEAWGLLNHNWTEIRSPVTVANSLEKMIEATLVG